MISIFSTEHIRYIIVRYHIEKVRPGQIHSELTNPDALVLYGIRPILNLALTSLYSRIPKIPNTTIEMVKQEYLNGLLDVPLANKRLRIEELVKLYNRTNDIDTKRQILRDIRAEVGEDDWRAAIAKSGKTTVNVNVQDEIIKRLFESNTQKD